MKNSVKKFKFFPQERNNENRELYNFVNIDIQGYELEALKGMKEHGME